MRELSSVTNATTGGRQYWRGHPHPQGNSSVKQDVPLLRIHVLSARGLPRSSRAVGMPDPYVVVKFNGEKVWNDGAGI